MENTLNIPKPLYNGGDQVLSLTRNCFLMIEHPVSYLLGANCWTYKVIGSDTTIFETELCKSPDEAIEHYKKELEELSQRIKNSINHFRELLAKYSDESGSFFRVFPKSMSVKD